jgi:hypothetical protein
MYFVPLFEKLPEIAKLETRVATIPALLKLFKEVVLDEPYKQRIIRHYNLFREVVDRKAI